MTVERQTWQVNGTECAHSIYMTSSQTGEGECKECDAKLRWVIPDTRLQATADAWCEYRITRPLDAGRLRLKLYLLLDALVEEDNDE